MDTIHRTATVCVVVLFVLSSTKAIAQEYYYSYWLVLWENVCEVGTQGEYVLVKKCPCGSDYATKPIERSRLKFSPCPKESWYWKILKPWW